MTTPPDASIAGAGVGSALPFASVSGQIHGLHIASAKGCSTAGALAVARGQVVVDAGSAECVPALGDDCVLVALGTDLYHTLSGLNPQWLRQTAPRTRQRCREL